MSWDQALVCLGADTVLHYEQEIKALKLIRNPAFNNGLGSPDPRACCVSCRIEGRYWTTSGFGGDQHIHQRDPL